MHKGKFSSYNKDFQELFSDLNQQGRMNKKFIKDLPTTEKEVLKELGYDVAVAGVVAGTSSSAGFGDEPKIKRKDKEVFFQ